MGLEKMKTKCVNVVKDNNNINKNKIEKHEDGNKSSKKINIITCVPKSSKSIPGSTSTNVNKLTVSNITSSQKKLNKPKNKPPIVNKLYPITIINNSTDSSPTPKTRLKSSSRSRSCSEDESASEKCISQINPFIVPDDSIKIIRNKVDAAIRRHKIFSMNGNWHSIRNSLFSRGWLEKLNPGYIPSNCDSALVRRLQFLTIPELMKGLNDKDAHVYKQLIFSKMIGSANVSLYWDLKRETYHNNPDIYKNTLLNVVPKTRFNYANKQGLALCAKEAHWYYNPGVSQLTTPRSYCLINTENPEQFIYDFKITAAISLLKWIIYTHENHVSKLISESGIVPIGFFHFALQECIKFIKKLKHEDIDQDLQPADEQIWQEFLEYFYKAVHVGNHFEATFEETEISLVHKSKTMLNKLKQVWSYVDMDGYMNIWILKPSFGCMGIGIHFCRTLEYVLKVITEKKPRRFVIQKYIERPLLIHNTKFDIRQWFLISSTAPLTVWIYKECYLRFSSQTYNLRKLHESIHLTNNSIQSKYHNGNRDPAIPKYNMWNLQEFKNHLSSIGYPTVYNDVIFPGMKECIRGALLASYDCIIPRAKSFEIHGADFMLTEDFQPWLIEINSKPALHRSTPVTSKLCPAVLEDLIKVVIDRARNPKASTGKFVLMYKETIPCLTSPDTNFYVEGKPLPLEYFLSKDQELEMTKVNSRNSQISIQSYNIINKSDYMKYVGREMKAALRQMLSLIVQEKEKRRNAKRLIEEADAKIQEVDSNISTVEEIYRCGEMKGSSIDSLHHRTGVKLSERSLVQSIELFSENLLRVSDSKLAVNCISIEKALNCKNNVKNVITIFDNLTNSFV